MSEVTYEILKAHTDNTSIDVLFFNPYYVGQNAEDPNPHATKTVRVPMTDQGEVDHDALKVVLEQQAMGVRHRMEIAYRQSQGSVSLGEMLGIPTGETVEPAPEPSPEGAPKPKKK